MTVKGGATPACAACKFQRRKCTPSCPLAPYFPASDPKVFQSVHRLFGVKNITNTLAALETRDQKEDAMKSIIYEAEMRRRFPVHGCSVIICQLRMQLQCAIDEMRCVYAQLDACRKQGQQSEMMMNGYLLLGENGGLCDELNHGETSNSGRVLGGALVEMESCSDMKNHGNFKAIGGHMESVGVDEERNLFFYPDFEGIHFNRMMMDHRQSSPDSPLKDNENTMEQICRTDLRTAAAGFSLTTVI